MTLNEFILNHFRKKYGENYYKFAREQGWCSNNSEARFIREVALLVIQELRVTPLSEEKYMKRHLSERFYTDGFNRAVKCFEEKTRELLTELSEKRT